MSHQDGRAPERVPLATLFANATHTLPRIAPDGKCLAYLSDQYGIYNIWTQQLATGAERQVTFATVSIKDYHWLPDGSGFAFVLDQGGDENDHMYRYDFASGVCSKICAYDGVRCQFLSVNYRHPEAILLTANLRDQSVFDVYRYDLKKASLSCVAQNPGDVISWVADRNLVVRLATSWSDAGGMLLSLIEHGEYIDLVACTHDDTLQPIEFLADDDLLLLSSVGAEMTRLLKVNVFADVSTVLYEHPQFDIVDVATALDGSHVQFVATQHDQFMWHSLDAASARHIAALNQQIPGMWAVVSRDASDQRWIIRCEADTAPVSYYFYDVADCRSRLLFCEYPELEHYTFAQMKAISFEARDGLTLHGYFTAALSSEDDQPAPLMLLVHDGPWSRDHWGWQPEVQWLVNRGYSVLQVNFRGSSGFGKRVLNAGDREWGGKMHLDILDAKAWAVAQGLALESRCGIYGFNYGGFEVLTALSQSPDSFACGVALSAPASLLTFLEAAPAYWTPQQAMLRARIGDIVSERQFLEARSPLSHVEQIIAPLLLGQGANDPQVKLHEVEAIVDRMHDERKEVRYVLFYDEGHGLRKPHNRLRFYEIAEGFLEQNLPSVLMPVYS